ncbi:MAG: SusD/RagB family nutrient-binding outer membrane lipoprotein [Bacteroidota bacterium]
MKKLIIFVSFFVIASSCQKLEDLNENTKDPELVSGESLFTGAQKNIVDQMVSTNVNNNVFRLFAQQWTETTYIDESIYDLVKRSVPDNHWDVIYRDVLKDLKSSAELINKTSYPTDASPLIKTNKLAIVEIMSVYSWGVLVETFGNVPYTQALDASVQLPKYDDGLTIYKDLIVRLNAAITKLNLGVGSFEAADNMYYGDTEKWFKFANSLKLRMAMLLADVDPSLSKATAESASLNLISSNADNASMVYLNASPNTNPLYSDLIASGRHDFVPANTFVDVMNGLNDPRLALYFTQIDTSSVEGVEKLAYVGGVYGAKNSYSKYSHFTERILDPTFEGTILDYSEVEFLLAEAVERGYAVGGTAESHYNNAITASIEYWGGTSADATAYLATTAVNYSTATGDYKEKIGMQKWIALYNRGFEAWTDWRRFDYPALVAPEDALSGIPVRYTFPIAEQTLNGANYGAASSAIHGDRVETKLFWDLY